MGYRVEFPAFQARHAASIHMLPPSICMSMLHPTPSLGLQHLLDVVDVIDPVPSHPFIVALRKALEAPSWTIPVCRDLDWHKTNV